jgi:putative intracellular protease/amidase
MTHFAQSDSHQWRGDSGEFVIQPCNTPGRLAALKLLSLGGNQLTSVPAVWEEGGALEQSGCYVIR